MSGNGTTVGERLKRARLRAAMTQDELTAASGIPKATISRIENGLNAEPRVSTIRKLAAALSVDPGWILVGDAADEERNIAT